ncbi:hypothetical protein FMH15_21490 [Vibrio alginolyticus]|uniref:hypothetical protein n=1 Tax=Vibrio parahaemolyticus TaxID=670 RepID=UPI001121B51F|nr:hypothetical protein [Vibrio parahaemolyticus]EGR0269186.1 hypothetical protein [Vibrio alginolyticus]TNZ87097.1 hypothetical protein CGK37_25270 [Vibrio parahaemolyticus]TOA08363.1 hypothetical protein CGK34_24960 [Vibrio parahaemolyticus]HCG6477842.1 hypothetical protein [Vibrio parahaemolyticus]
MSYEVVKLACENLTVLEKMKLAQYLVQTSVQAMEKEKPAAQVKPTATQTKDQVVSSIQERVLKSKPSKVSSMKNFIRAMFNFQGGISDSEIDSILKDLKKKKVFRVDGAKVIYL